MEGLFQWLTRQIEQKMAGKSLNERKRIIRNNRKNFDTIIQACNISKKNMDKPLKDDAKDSVLGLFNPYS